MSWADVKKTISNLLVVNVSKKDFRAFELPIPSVCEKVVSGEIVPGVSKKNRDTTFPAHSRIIRITDNSISEKLLYLRKKTIEKNVILNDKFGFFIIKNNNVVNAYRNSINNSKLSISFSNGVIVDGKSGTHWDLRGKYISGKISQNLESITISDEYWFSWKKFQGESRLIRL